MSLPIDAVGGASVAASMAPVSDAVVGSPRILSSGDKTFGAVLEKLSETFKTQDFFGNGLHRDLSQLQQHVLSGKMIDARELLLYQVKAGHFNMRVELISKAAESALGVVKKLQSQP